MAIPLFPGYLGLHAEAASHDYEMIESQYQNIYETQTVEMTQYDTVKKAEVVTSTVPELTEEEIALCPEAHLALDEISSKKTFTKGQRCRGEGDQEGRPGLVGHSSLRAESTTNSAKRLPHLPLRDLCWYRNALHDGSRCRLHCFTTVRRFVGRIQFAQCKPPSQDRGGHQELFPSGL